MFSVFPQKHASSKYPRKLSVTFKLIAVAGLASAILFSAACSSTSQGFNGSQTTPTGAAAVQVTPGSAELQSAGTLQFNAVLTGTSSTAVTWNANVGTISSSGLFKAPVVSSATQAQIIATSASKSASPGSATITILPAGSSDLTIVTSALPSAAVGSPYTQTLDAAGGTPPYTWGATGLPAGLSVTSTGTFGGSASHIGSYPLEIQVSDAVRHTATWTTVLEVAANQTSGTYDGPAELPLAYVQTAMADTPAPGATTQVSAGQDLQTALNNAQCGDTLELQAGAVFTGLFVVPAKSCDDQHWIIVRTNAPDSSLPPEGVRISPCYAGVSYLPGRPAFNCASTQNVMAQLSLKTVGNGPIQLASGANHYRFIGLEITRVVGSGYVGSLVSTQTGATATEIIFDRSWLHGTTADDTGLGVALGGITYSAVVNSYLSDFHCTSKVGACIDSHAVSGGNSTTPGGPYAIVNNFLEAAGENVLFGGGAATTTPTDIQISQNHFFKPLLWMKGQAGFIGGEGGNPFVVKNHLELKNAQRVLAEDNIFEDNWGGFTQYGHSILLTPKDQYNGVKGNVCPICQVTDVTIRYSTISHVGAGISMGTSVSDGGGQALAGERYSIHDIVIDDINATTYNGGGGFLEYANGWTTNVLNSVTVNHVTAFPDPSGHLMLLYNNTTNQTMWGFIFTNNIVNATTSPVWNGNGNKLSCAVHDKPLTSFNACFTSYSFTNNVIPAVTSQYPTSDWPTGNSFPATDAAVQFVNYNNGNGGDYHLAPNSPYKNTGNDGKDPGADIDLVDAGIAGVY